MAEIRSAITLITLPVYFLVAGVLFRRNLWKSYFFFWVSLIVEGLAVVSGYLAADSQKAVVSIYLVAQPLICLLYVLMVLEVFRKVFSRFPGIARFAQRVVLISMLVAFIFALSSMGVDLVNGWSGSALLRRYSAVSRAITSALSIFMIFIAAFLVWMPIPLPPNTIRHSYLFFLYFMPTSGVYYLLNTSKQPFIQVANLIFSCLTLAALLSWLFLLREDGESVPTDSNGPRPSSGEILDRLESINRTLSGIKE